MIRRFAIDVLRALALVAFGPLYSLAEWGFTHLMELRRMGHAPRDR